MGWWLLRDGARFTCGSIHFEENAQTLFRAASLGEVKGLSSAEMAVSKIVLIVMRISESFGNIIVAEVKKPVVLAQEWELKLLEEN